MSTAPETCADCKKRDHTCAECARYAAQRAEARAVEIETAIERAKRARPEPLRLYRVFWAADDDMGETETLRFVAAKNDEEAFREGVRDEPDASARREGPTLNLNAFYSVEDVTGDDERIRDVLDDCPALNRLPEACLDKLAGRMAAMIARDI